MPIDIDKLQIEIEATSSDAASKIEQLATALSNLKSSAKGGAGLTTTTKQLQALSNAANLINGTNLNSQKIQQFASAMNSLSNIQKASGLSSTINALRKLPEISSSLEKSDLGKFATQMNQVASAMRPLATEMQKVANGFSAFPIRIQKIIQSNTGLAASNNKAAKSFGVLGTGISSAQAKFGVYLIAFRRLASVMSDWVRESNDYVENLNLFTVAMGEYAESAKAYAEEVQALTGIDSSEWMRNQGVFMQMASGFGVASDSAALMSKNLTQLGYDISSFYNISIEEAMQKLQSGLAGEIEPLRRLGYAIDVASLQQVALNHGITESVNAMTQAEKSQLRYIAIMEQSSNAMGDLSRTIQTPANAIRILNQQIVQLRRALGNMLIPILQQVIPWVQAFVEVLTEAAQAIANFLGFELPTIDYSGLDGVSVGASEAEDAIGGATDAAKKMKRELLGIDELTILEPNAASGAGGAGGVGGAGGDLGLELPEYDFLNGLEEKTNSIKDFLKDISDEIIAIGAGLAAWKISSKVLGWFKDLSSGKFNKINKLAAGITMMVTGFTLAWQGSYDIGYNGPNIQNVIKTAIGSALGIAGSLLVFGTGPVGWTIGIVAALAITITGIVLGYNKRQLENELSNRFGDIELTVEEAKELAEKIMSSPLSIQLEAYVTAKSNAEQAVEDYLESVNSLNDLVWRVQVGIEVDSEEIVSSVDAMLANAQSILSSYREVYTLTIGISFSDVNVQTDMAAFVNEYFSKSQSDLVELGTEMKQTILDAISDGVIDEEEMQTIQNLQSEINQMMSAVASAEYKARLNNAVFELQGDISYESVKSVSDEINTILQNQLDTLEETKLQALSAIELKHYFDGNYDEYIAAYNDAIETNISKQAQIEAQAFQPLVDKISVAFRDVLAENADLFSAPLNDFITPMFAETFGADETGILVKDNIRVFVDEVKNSWTGNIGIARDEMSGATRAALEESLKALTPTAEDLTELAEQCRTAGVTVPKEIADGLVDYHQLAALNGNADSINYLLGRKFSTDPSFIEALSKAEDASEMLTGAIADGFLDNTEIKQNVDGTISFINDEIGALTVNYTPELKNLFSQLGITLTDSLESSVTSGTSDAMNGVKNSITSATSTQSELSTAAYNGGNYVGKQIGKGISEGIESAKKAVKESSESIISYAKNAMEYAAKIKSPSRLFRDEVGVYIGAGVSEGIKKSIPEVNSVSNMLMDSSVGNMKYAFDTISNKFGENSKKYLTASSIRDNQILRNGTDSNNIYENENFYDPSESNSEVINAIVSAAERITKAVGEISGDVYMDGDKVGQRVTAWQNRQIRMYRKPIQQI